MGSAEVWLCKQDATSIVDIYERRVLADGVATFEHVSVGWSGFARLRVVDYSVPDVAVSGPERPGETLRVSLPFELGPRAPSFVVRGRFDNAKGYGAAQSFVWSDHDIGYIDCTPGESGQFEFTVNGDDLRFAWGGPDAPKSIELKFSAQGLEDEWNGTGSVEILWPPEEIVDLDEVPMIRERWLELALCPTMPVQARRLQ